MSVDPQRLLELAVSADAHRLEAADLDNALSTAVALLSRANGSGEAVKRGLLAITIRALEMVLLSDAEVVNLSKFWDSRLGEARQVVTERCRALLGVEPPEALLVHVLKCLRSPVGRNGRGGRQHDRLAEQLIVQSVNAHPRRHLRCSCCGYHFRNADMGADRNRFAQNVDAVFSDELHPLRQEDVLKPALFPNRDKKPPTSATELTIDHEIPEYGLGWPEADNLKLLCKFCNGGKLIYRAPYEVLSTSVAASLNRVVDGDGHSLGRQVSVVAALRASDGKCSVCGKNNEEVELTVREAPKGMPSCNWFVPWTLRVLCYEHCAEGI